jgi:D-xylose transport system substrate-binding protein
MEGIPVSGQDGDHAALNRVAKGTQTVSVWKDARELGKAAGEAAVALVGGASLSDVGQTKFTTPGGVEVDAIFLAPIPITKDNLTTVTDAGWIDVETLCQGVENGPPPCN